MTLRESYLIFCLNPMVFKKRPKNPTQKIMAKFSYKITNIKNVEKYCPLFWRKICFWLVATTKTKVFVKKLIWKVLEMRLEIRVHSRIIRIFDLLEYNNTNKLKSKKHKVCRIELQHYEQIKTVWNIPKFCIIQFNYILVVITTLQFG